MRLLLRRPLGSLPRNAHYKKCRPGYIFIIRRCYSVPSTRTYDDAISLLNTLQTPYAELKKQWDSGTKRGASDLQHTQQCFRRMGYERKDLEKLNIVHVAGTKGKGTVCAYVDSILNQFRMAQSRANPNQCSYKPLKIGLYTSPHLISVRERIRINSAPISEALFVKYFFEVWDKICAPEDEMKPKPVYFRFLTLMSFHVYLSEGVDCAIYEVGMGGQWDATNIIQKPAVTGISALGIDHTFQLGSTIDQISWHKAGIFKKGVMAYTVEQPPEAMEVLTGRALNAKAEGFQIVGEDPFLKLVDIRPDAPFQKSNANLALRLSKQVLRRLNPEGGTNLTRDYQPWFKKGLEEMVSRGRCEKKVDGNIIWYLDGAHTAESIAIASKWFCDEVTDKPGPRVLIFNQQGHRESIQLLNGLFAAFQGKFEFDHVIFCPSVPPASSTSKDHVNFQTDIEAVSGMTMQQIFAGRWLLLSSNASSQTSVRIHPSLEDSFEFIRKLQPAVEPKGGDQSKEAGEEGIEGENGERVHVLITGSIHLVGRALSILEGANAL